jgi:phage shock protein E
VNEEAVRRLLQAGALVLDVRTPGEFAAGAYPGAINIPVQELARRVAEVPRGRPIVVYCAAGIRSAWAERFLRMQGHAEVVNAGGLDDLPR